MELSKETDYKSPSKICSTTHRAEFGHVLEYPMEIRAGQCEDIENLQLKTGVAHVARRQANSQQRGREQT